MPNVPDGLFQGISALTRLVLDAESLDATLKRIVELACTAVGATDVCGITLVDQRGTPTTAAFTDPVAPEVDAAQYRARRGPCLDAYRERAVMRWNAGESDERWPEFAVEAKLHGIRSSLSLPLLPSVSEATGALNMYAKSEHAFPSDVEPSAMLFAEQVAVACATAEMVWQTRALTMQLQRAVESRDLIGQAKGIIMVTAGCDADAAFRILVSQSQHEGRKLVEVAEEIVQRHNNR